MKVKTRVTGECFIYVEGMKMNCPLCGVIVESGQQHRCKAIESEAKHQRKLRKQIARESSKP